MQKRIFSILLLAVLLLGACSPKTGDTATGTPAATDVAAATSQADTGAPVAEATQEIVASGPAECRTVNMFDETQLPAFPAVTKEDWILGNYDAPITILEYSDVQCPYCGLMEPNLVDYVNAHPDKVRLVFRHFPLNIHDKSTLAATIVEAAGKQGLDKFEALKNALFSSQAEWSAMDADAFTQYAKDLAGTLGINVDQLATDMEDDAVKEKVVTQYAEGYQSGVSYTPYVMINHLLFQGQMTPDLMDEIVTKMEAIEAESPGIFNTIPHFIFSDAASLQADVDYYKSLIAEKGQEYADSIPYYFVDDATNTPLYLKMYETLKATIKDRQFTSCPDQVIDPTKSYKAILKTEKGDITIQLFPDVAPVAVNSFVFLARAGWFDNITFHRVVPDFVAQTGDPSGLGIGGPGYLFDNEINPDYLFDQPGRVGMANSGAGTNGSQFFITYKAAPNLNGSYTVFGQVIEGMDVLQQLTARSASAVEEADPGSKLISVEIVEE